MRCPSGDQAGPSPLLSGVISVPSAFIIHIHMLEWACPNEDEKAMRHPSGDQTGPPDTLSLLVSLVKSVPSAFTEYISEFGGKCRSSSYRVDAKAMRRPETKRAANRWRRDG